MRPGPWTSLLAYFGTVLRGPFGKRVSFRVKDGLLWDEGRVVFGVKDGKW